MNERISLADKKSEVKSQNLVPQIRRKTESFQTMNSPVDRILFLQRTIGNQAVARMIKSGVLQAKLRIGQPGDIYEQEADRVVEQVMQMPEPVQRKCPKCEDGVRRQPAKEEEKKTLQTKKIAPSSTPEVAQELESRISAIHGDGQPLPEFVRAYFEPRFRRDFSDVRVHDSGMAAASAKATNARAYTLGNKIVFGAEQYRPQTEQGKRLLAHELTHVLQQEGVRTTPTIQRECGDPDFCTPYPTAVEAAEAESWIRSYYLPIEEMKFGSNSRALYESYLSRRPGDSLVPVEFNDPSSDIVASFAESWATADDQDKIIDLIGARLSRTPGGPLQDNTPTTMSVENFLSRSEMNNRPINYSNPFSIAGHIAGDIGSSDAGSDYRNVEWGNVTLEKVPLFGSVGYINVETTLHYEVFDAIDFCPGGFGSKLEQYITVPMSRLEKTGEAYDVPFKVKFVPESRSKRFFD